MAGHIELTIREEDPTQPDVLALLAASDLYHKGLYPPESNHLIPASSLTGEGRTFLVARIDGRAVGCGGMVDGDGDGDGDGGYAELKRMWVDPETRGCGVGRRLLEALVDVARDRGHHIVHLETGVRQTEAIGLYRNSGFRDCPPFGTYDEDPLSLFMAKEI